jgi:invasion protein IalB
MRYHNLRPRVLFGLALGLAFTNAGAQPEPGSLTPPPEAQPPQEGQQGEVTDVERFEDWAVRCGEIEDPSGDTAQVCEMLQRVSIQETGQPVMEMAIGYLPEREQPVAVFTLPLGIRLPPGVQLTVDGGEPIRFPVQICVRQGCRADLVLTPELIESMRNGTEAQIAVIDPRGQPVRLPVSLIGFTAALERIQP